MLEISDEEFDGYVRQALETLDPQFSAHLEEVPVIVDDLPLRTVWQEMRLAGPYELLGLFQGVPLNQRSVEQPGGPNQIVLYRKSILGICRTRSQLARQIRKTIIHELGHYLGFSESQLRHYRY